MQHFTITVILRLMRFCSKEFSGCAYQVVAKSSIRLPYMMIFSIVWFWSRLFDIDLGEALLKRSAWLTPGACTASHVIGFFNMVA